MVLVNAADILRHLICNALSGTSVRIYSFRLPINGVVVLHIGTLAQRSRDNHVIYERIGRASWIKHAVFSLSTFCLYYKA